LNLRPPKYEAGVFNHWTVMFGLMQMVNSGLISIFLLKNGATAHTVRMAIFMLWEVFSGVLVISRELWRYWR
jgi:hypothetical protein